MKHVLSILLVCLFLTACHKTSTPRGILSKDLSYSLICPDSIPTDEVYSWWSESAKQSWIEYGNEPMEDRWFINASTSIMIPCTRSPIRSIT